MIIKKQRTTLFPFLLFFIISILLFATVVPQGSLSTDPLPVTLTGENIVAQITIETGTQTIEPNTDFVATITVQPGQDIAGVQCSLHYDPSLITVINITEGNLFTGYNTYFIPGTNNPTSGTLAGIACAITTPGGHINQTGIFAVLHLKTLMNTGTSSLGLSNVVIGEPTAESLPVTIQNTQITIGQEAESTLVSINPQQQILAPNKIHTFSIWVSPTLEIAGIQATLKFDPTIIQILNITPGTLFGSTTYFHTTPIDNLNGAIDSISSVTTAPGGTLQAGTLAEITVKSLQKTGNTPLSLTDVLIGDPQGNPVFVITQNGTISIGTADSTQVTITPSVQQISQGDTVTVDIHINPQDLVAGIQFDLTFDPSLLTAHTVTPGNFFLGTESYFHNGTIDNTQGVITGVAGATLGDNSGTINPGNFARVIFTAQPKSGQTLVQLTNIILGDQDATPLPFTVTSGTIEVLINYTSISINPQDTYISPGDTFTLDILVNPLEAISGVETDITFDPTLLTAISVQEGDLFTGYSTYFNNGTIDNTQGTIQDIWGVIADVGGGSTTIPGIFAQVTFTAKMASGSTPITLSNSLIGTPEATPLQINILHGTVTIGFKHTLTYSLKTGWNAISLPFQETITAETLGQTIGVSDAIAQWNQISQEYLIHPVGIMGQDFPIEPGHGYLIHAYQNTQFSIEGTITENLTVPIKTGWNLLGWIHSNTTTAEQFGSTIPGCDTVAIWNTETQNYIIHPQGTPLTNFTIRQGDALFIHTTQDSIWQG